MAATYNLVSSQVLGLSAASVTFSSIPQTYTDLVLRCSTRTNDTGSDWMQLNFNGDTSTNYSYTYMRGNSSAGTSGRATSGTYIYSGQQDDATNTANTFADTEFYIPSYTTTNNKPLSVASMTEDNSASSNAIIFSSAQLWRGTAAITSIAITLPSTVTFNQYSSFYLYGIRNS